VAATEPAFDNNEEISGFYVFRHCPVMYPSSGGMVCVLARHMIGNSRSFTEVMLLYEHTVNRREKKENGH